MSVKNSGVFGVVFLDGWGYHLGDWIISLTDSANGSAIASAHHNQLLAEMFPAMTLPAGANHSIKLAPDGEMDRNYNMPELFMTDSAKWPRTSDYNGFLEWRHSDFKDMAYCHVYSLFDAFKEIANLDK
jgi:hypothetical protein